MPSSSAMSCTAVQKGREARGGSGDRVDVQGCDGMGDGARRTDAPFDGDKVTDPTPPRRRLHGAREYAADLLRHLVALLVSFTIVFLAISGGTLLSGSSDEIVGSLRLIVAMAGATLLGHGLVTRLRGHVSLIASGFFTWISLVAIFSLQMLGADRESIVANLWFSLLVGLPIVVLMTVLRAVVPGFQVRAAGHRVRPRMSSDA